MLIRILAILCLLPVAAWAVSGDDRAPGDACANEDAVTMTANPSGSGGYVLTCEGGTWKATLSGATPTEDEHFATKAYVDSAGGSGGGGCSNVGDLCADGTLYAGVSCDVDFITGSSGTCYSMYTPPQNQSAGAKWRTSNASSPALSSSNGKFNDGVVSNSNTYPAFKLCKDLSYGGHTDWYLPAYSELESILLSGNKLPYLTTGAYWSSTASTITGWAFSSIGQFQQVTSYPVRCVRRE